MGGGDKHAATNVGKVFIAGFWTYGVYSSLKNPKCHFPNKAVSYPASCKSTGKNGSSIGIAHGSPGVARCVVGGCGVVLVVVTRARCETDR